MSIVAVLSAKRLKFRTGRDWSYGVIKAIVKRIDTGAVVFCSRELVLSEGFLRACLLQQIHPLKRKEVIMNLKNLIL